MTCAKNALAVVAVVTTVAAAEAQAGDGGWSAVHTRDGVAVSSRPRPGSVFHEMRVVSDFDAPPERILAVLGDIEHYPQFMPPTSAARLLSRDGDISYYYMEISPPVIARRDYCIRVGIEKLPDGRMRSYWVADNSGCLPERRGIVRVLSNDGEWLLEPIDGGRRTHVIYRCHIEVGGRVPAWMVNRVSATELPNVFAAVRRVVGQPRYAACTAGSCR